MSTPAAPTTLPKRLLHSPARLMLHYVSRRKWQFIAVTLLFPKGLLGLWSQLRNRLRPQQAAAVRTAEVAQ